MDPNSVCCIIFLCYSGYFTLLLSLASSSYCLSSVVCFLAVFFLDTSEVCIAGQFQEKCCCMRVLTGTGSSMKLCQNWSDLSSLCFLTLHYFAFLDIALFCIVVTAITHGNCGYSWNVYSLVSFCLCINLNLKPDSTIISQHHLAIGGCWETPCSNTHHKSKIKQQWTSQSLDIFCHICIIIHGTLYACC